MLPHVGSSGAGSQSINDAAGISNAAGATCGASMGHLRKSFLCPRLEASQDAVSYVRLTSAVRCAQIAAIRPTRDERVTSTLSCPSGSARRKGDKREKAVLGARSGSSSSGTPSRTLGCANFPNEQSANSLLRQILANSF